MAVKMERTQKTESSESGVREEDRSAQDWSQG